MATVAPRLPVAGSLSHFGFTPLWEQEGGSGWGSAWPTGLATRTGRRDCPEVRLAAWASGKGRSALGREWGLGRQPLCGAANYSCFLVTARTLQGPGTRVSPVPVSADVEVGQGGCVGCRRELRTPQGRQLGCSPAGPAPGVPIRESPERPWGACSEVHLTEPESSCTQGHGHAEPGRASLRLTAPEGLGQSVPPRGLVGGTVPPHAPSLRAHARPGPAACHPCGRQN